MHTSVSIIHFTSHGILKTIKNYDLNKAHDHNMVSICMTKICDASNCKPLELIV